MITLIQRVINASVLVNNQQYSTINNGYLIFLGIFKDDSEKDINKLTEKISTLRIMSDQKGKMNRSILDVRGEILLVSQFTLCANLKGGRRPDFFPAEQPKEAERLFNLFAKKLVDLKIPTKTGKFGAYMHVDLINDGPVTFILDSNKI